MHKIAITIRKKDDCFTFFMNDTYYQFLSPYFKIELVLPRTDHQYQDIVQRNDALLICGGDDIDPYYYHQKTHPLTTLEDKDIEEMDFALLQQFYQNKKTIIGICRGIQVINVFFKGTLIQDIPSQYPTYLHHSKEHHSIQVLEHTFLSRYFQKNNTVNSFHHQNILTVSPLLHVNAISEDGLIEGIENHHVLAVQWHPERLDEQHKKQFIKMIIDFIELHH